MRKTYAVQLRTALLASAQNATLASDLAHLTERELEFLLHDWQVWASDAQLAPLLFASGDSPRGEPAAGCEAPTTAARLFASGDFTLSPAPSDSRSASLPEGALKRVWAILGGRGSGKTRAGAEWVRSVVYPEEVSGPAPCGRLPAGEQQGAKQTRIALVGKTMHDVRTVMVEGVSGLLACHPAHQRPLYEPSKRRLTWPNGAIAEMYSADEAEGLRGPQFSAAWCDELAKWRNAEAAWDMLQFALRLGDAPRVVVTTTPRSTVFLKKLLADDATVSVRLSTADNAVNLAPTFLAEMTRRYAGSALGRQELLGEIVDDSADSLWRRAWIDAARVAAPPELRRVIVALDPPVTATAASDACGIVVAGLGVDGRAYVLADRTIQGRTPDTWARAAIAAYDDFKADRMVAEVNQGGDLVIGVIHQFKPNLPVAKVRATRGKWVRAEPVAALYAEGRVAHCGRFDALEDQLAAFGADGTVKGKSPDRADALVWAITELMLGDDVRPQIRPL